MASPIQIVLNAENYEEARDKGGGGSRTDFFADKDGAFREHKAELIKQLQAVATALRAQPESEIGYAKVILRREAWAKSHRPVKKLFKLERTPIVGGDDLGVMLVEITPEAALAIAQDIAQHAEERGIKKYDDLKGKDVPNPSVCRSETGAIERVELYQAADKRQFSAQEAVAWLSSDGIGGNYQIELFELPPPRQTWDAQSVQRQRLYESFVQGLHAIGQGMVAHTLRLTRHRQPLLAVRLGVSALPPAINLLPQSQKPSTQEVSVFNTDVGYHQKLLSFLDRHPLVRRIELPGKVIRSSTVNATRLRPDTVEIPAPDMRRSYPRLGIIDGGISPALSDWVIHRWDLLADEHADLRHGTFIAGLTALGTQLNGSTACPEIEPCQLADLAVFPNERLSGVFTKYFHDVAGFLDEVEIAISDARSRYGVRIFNLSLNVQQPANLSGYSAYAERLDQIADNNGVLLFISAGNTEPQNIRSEWHAEPERALADLATARNDGILIPAESIRNIAVAALNPPDLKPAIPFAPASYSRRGPGIRTGVKPDLAQVGGAGARDENLGHGLFSIAPDGSVLDGCGTSYAAPLVAKTAAVLDHAIEGEVSRETLTALLIHHAVLPMPLQAKAFSSVARHLSGFGRPPSAEQILETDDHSITLVFAARIRRDQQMSFKFNWPACLVTSDGKCTGRARLTLVATPPIDSRFGAEFVRINIDASLQQEQSNGGWRNKLDPIYLPMRNEWPTIEAERIEHGLKWSPVKALAKDMPRGIGASSSWRLFVSYLTRHNEDMPEDGIPFTAILTIEDLDKAKPVFNDMKQNLRALGVQISDIRTAARITPRV